MSDHGHPGATRTMPPDPADAGRDPVPSRRSWWPDRRPVQRWYAVSMLVLGGVMVLTWVATTLAGVRADDAGGWFPLVVGLGWLAVAGFEVARPGPDRLSVVVYRCAFFLTLLTVIAVAVHLLVGTFD